MEKKQVGFVQSNCSHDYNEFIRQPPSDVPQKQSNNSQQQPVPMSNNDIYALVIITTVAAVMIALTIVFLVRLCRRRRYAQISGKAPDVVVVAPSVDLRELPSVPTPHN